MGKYKRSGIHIFADSKAEAVERARKQAEVLQRHGVKLYPEKVEPDGEVRFLTGKKKNWFVPARRTIVRGGK